MSKTLLYLLGIGVLIVVFGFIMVRGGSGAGSLVASAGSGSGEVQNVALSMKDFNYYPNTVNVKVGQPVRISLDSNVRGCLRSFTIRDFGINKYLKTPSDYIEFTPTKKGRYSFACSMGMGIGTLVVE